MKLISLTKGQFAQVDDADYDWLMTWKWYAQKDKNTYYANRVETHPKRKVIAMHNLIMNPPEGMEVDHQDHNGLHCERHNMRNCTHRQNGMNRSPWGKSKYLGVSFNDRGCIRARITIDGYKLFLGYFKTEEQAAIAYDVAALEHHKEFANLNFKP